MSKKDTVKIFNPVSANFVKNKWVGADWGFLVQLVKRSILPAYEGVCYDEDDIIVFYGFPFDKEAQAAKQVGSYSHEDFLNGLIFSSSDVDKYEADHPHIFNKLFDLREFEKTIEIYDQLPHNMFPEEWICAADVRKELGLHPDLFFDLIDPDNDGPLLTQWHRKYKKSFFPKRYKQDALLPKESLWRISIFANSYKDYCEKNDIKSELLPDKGADMPLAEARIKIKRLKKTVGSLKQKLEDNKKEYQTKLDEKKAIISELSDSPATKKLRENALEGWKRCLGQAPILYDEIKLCGHENFTKDEFMSTARAFLANLNKDQKDDWTWNDDQIKAFREGVPSEYLKQLQAEQAPRHKCINS